MRSFSGTPTAEIDVYGVKLGEEFLMPSLFTVAEVELARLGLSQVSGTGPVLVVGGWGRTVVRFPNHLTGGSATKTLYVAT